MPLVAPLAALLAAPLAAPLVLATPRRRQKQLDLTRD